MGDYSDYSAPELVRMLGSRFKDGKNWDGSSDPLGVSVGSRTDDIL